MSLPPREAWIEINMLRAGDRLKAASLPPREAWIEIYDAKADVVDCIPVASPAGSVD